MHSPTDTDGDINLVEGWLKADPKRWLAGVLAGLFAALIAIAVAGIISVVGGMEFLFPVKLMATWVLGASATELGMHLGAIAVGFGVIGAICGFWGFVYAQFVRTNCLGPLLAMGLVWGIFSWVFEWNLFFHSIKPILTADVSPAPVFFICLAYGISLTSVAFFDRSLR
jgi:hypothetical protein